MSSGIEKSLGGGAVSILDGSRCVGVDIPFFVLVAEWYLLVVGEI